MRLDLDDGADVNLDMGPLIDCVFLLLIFFLVSTTMKKPETEIPVDLPDPAVSAVETASAGTRVLTIDARGTFFWEGAPVGQQELHHRLRELGETAPDTHLRIRVDRAAPARFLVQVLDLCAYEGLTRYAIHTQDRNAPPAGGDGGPP